MSGTSPPSPERVIEVLLARIEADLAAIIRSQHDTQAGATHQEARPEHAKDTRATEASYLARGLARRVSQLEEAQLAVARLGAAAGSHASTATNAILGTLLEVRDEEREVVQTILLSPAGGGLELDVDGWPIRAVTITSPMGRALMNHEAGDVVEVGTPQGVREWTIVSLL